MSKVDLVVFGATGFTGKRAVEELAYSDKKYAGVTWAVAGRSQKKLEELLAEVTKITGLDVSSTEIIIADVSDYESLKRMCARARVVVNACGPYRHYGEPVVRAAVESKAHYVDVSGEPEFIEKMQLNYDQKAREAGVYVVSACGFDSIPNDMGVVLLEQNFPGTLNSVESYLTSNVDPEYYWESVRSGAINYGTWESLVYGIANQSELGPLRKKLFPEPMPKFKPKLESKGIVHRRGSGWCVPFPGSDLSIVYRSQRAQLAQGKRPVQFRPYVQFGSLLAVVMLALVGIVLKLFASFAFTRQWLLNHPRLFSLGLVARGPKREVNQHTTFKFELFGKGWERGQDIENTPPNKTIAARVSARDPGYGFTTLALLQSAVMIIKENDKLPTPGGVLTTAMAFRNTSLIKKLQENDVIFEIIDPK